MNLFYSVILLRITSNGFLFSSGNDIKVTLWGEHATSFDINHLYDESSPRVVVILVLGCLPRTMYSKSSYLLSSI